MRPQRRAPSGSKAPADRGNRRRQVSNKYVRDKMLLVLAAHALHFSGPAKFKVRPRPAFPANNFRSNASSSGRRSPLFCAAADS